jgi:hypothetical protein
MHVTQPFVSLPSSVRRPPGIPFRLNDRREEDDAETSGQWTLRSFVAAVSHPGDQAFLARLLSRFNK